MNQSIQKAIAITGSQSKLATLVGVSQKTVHRWLHGADFAGKYIPRIVIATDGKVSSTEIMRELDK